MSDSEYDDYADDGYAYEGGRVLWGRFAFWGVALVLMFVVGRVSAPEGTPERDLVELRQQNFELAQENENLRQQLAAQEAGGVDPGESGTTEEAAGGDDAEVEGAADDGGQEGQTYIVVQGDTLRGIAQRMYGDPEKASLIIEANGLDRDAPLRVGQELTIPPAE